MKSRQDDNVVVSLIAQLFITDIDENIKCHLRRNCFKILPVYYLKSITVYKTIVLAKRQHFKCYHVPSINTKVLQFRLTVNTVDN